MFPAASDDGLGFGRMKQQWQHVYLQDRVPDEEQSRELCCDGKGQWTAH